jgi:hypothetical protein
VDLGTALLTNASFEPMTWHGNVMRNVGFVRIWAETTTRCDDEDESIWVYGIRMIRLWSSDNRQSSNSIDRTLRGADDEHFWAMSHVHGCTKPVDRSNVDCRRRA